MPNDAGFANEDDVRALELYNRTKLGESPQLAREHAFNMATGIARGTNADPERYAAAKKLYEASRPRQTVYDYSNPAVAARTSAATAEAGIDPELTAADRRKFDRELPAIMRREAQRQFLADSANTMGRTVNHLSDGLGMAPAIAMEITKQLYAPVLQHPQMQALTQQVQDEAHPEEVKLARNVAQAINPKITRPPPSPEQRNHQAARTMLLGMPATRKVSGATYGDQSTPSDDSDQQDDQDDLFNKRRPMTDVASVGLDTGD